MQRRADPGPPFTGRVPDQSSRAHPNLLVAVVKEAVPILIAVEPIAEAALFIGVEAVAEAAVLVLAALLETFLLEDILLVDAAISAAELVFRLELLRLEPLVKAALRLAGEAALVAVAHLAQAGVEGARHAAGNLNIDLLARPHVVNHLRQVGRRLDTAIVHANDPVTLADASLIGRTTRIDALHDRIVLVAGVENDAQPSLTAAVGIPIPRKAAVVLPRAVEVQIDRLPFPVANDHERYSAALSLQRDQLLLELILGANGTAIDGDDDVLRLQPNLSRERLIADVGNDEPVAIVLELGSKLQLLLRAALESLVLLEALILTKALVLLEPLLVVLEPLVLLKPLIPLELLVELRPTLLLILLLPLPFLLLLLLLSLSFSLLLLSLLRSLPLLFALLPLPLFLAGLLVALPLLLGLDVLLLLVLIFLLLGQARLRGADEAQRDRRGAGHECESLHFPSLLCLRDFPLLLRIAPGGERCK
jgi:hypothetical protein